MILASNIVDGPGGAPNWIIVHNAAEARQAVRNSKDEGADFIKVYSDLSREEFFAIAKESKKFGLPFAGDVPMSVSVSAAYDAGMQSLEHRYQMPTAFSRHEEELLTLSPAARRPGASPELRRQVVRMQKDPLGREQAEVLLARLKRNHTWQTPTLVVL